MFLDPGGSFWDFPGAPGNFGGGAGAPKTHPDACEITPGTPFGRLRGCWAHFGSIWGRFWVDLGVDFETILDPFGMHFGTIFEPSEKQSMPLLPPLSLIGATMERSIDR